MDGKQPHSSSPSSPRSHQGEEEAVLLASSTPKQQQHVGDEAAGWFPSSIKQHASDFDLPQKANNNNTGTSSEHVTSPSSLYSVLVSPAFLALVAYSLCSTSMVISNKLVLSSYDFHFPMVLLFHQTLMTVNCLHIAKQLGYVTYEELNRKQVLQWLPLDVLFVLMLLTGFLSMTYLSIPMVTIFKNTNNMFIALGDGLLFRNFPTRGVAASLLLMVLAAVMAGLNDLEFSPVGYAWTLANCVTSSAYVLYAQFVMRHTTLSTFGKVYYNNVLALPLVLALDLFVFGDFYKLATYAEVDKFLAWDFAVLWFWSGVLGVLQSFCALKAQHLSSPTTYSMVGSLNKIPMTFLGVLVFHTAMTGKGVLYTALSILAGALYSYVKAKEEFEVRAARDAANAAQAIKNAAQAPAAAPAPAPPATTTHLRKIKKVQQPQPYRPRTSSLSSNEGILLLGQPTAASSSSPTNAPSSTT